MEFAAGSGVSESGWVGLCLSKEIRCGDSEVARWPDEVRICSLLPIKHPQDLRDDLCRKIGVASVIRMEAAENPAFA